MLGWRVGAACAELHCTTTPAATLIALSPAAPTSPEVVPPRLRPLTYAFDRGFEGAVGATAAPLVGVLARDAFGFIGAASVVADAAANVAHAAALAKALLLCTAVPWSACCLLYAPLHLTFKRDRRRAAAVAAAEQALAANRFTEGAFSEDVELTSPWRRHGGGGGDDKDAMAAEDSALLLRSP